MRTIQVASDVGVAGEIADDSGPQREAAGEKQGGKAMRMTIVTGRQTKQPRLLTRV
jgi:hypothetical protein